MTIQAVVWDLGGVLARTEDRLPRTQAAQRFGMTYEQLEGLVFNGDRAKLAALGAISAQDHWEKVCQVLSIPVDGLPALKAGFWGGDRLDMRLVDFIRSLRPHYRTALLSNAFSDLRRSLEQEWRIIDAFDDVVISSEVHLIKPDPEIYHLLLKRLNAEPPDVIFIDDFKENLEGAQKVGIQTIHFRSTDQVLSELHERLKRA